MNHLHDTKAINLDTSLKDLLANQPVEPEGRRVDLFVGHNVLFLTAENKFEGPTGTAVPPVDAARADSQRSSSQIARVAQSGLINLDATLRSLVESDVVGQRSSDFWALYIHSAYVLLHVPDTSGSRLTPEATSSIAKELHG
jgi:hypothetical protein